MNKDQIRELAKYLATILAGVSVVGYGLGLYHHDWPCFVIAILTTKIGAAVVWRAFR